MVSHGFIIKSSLLPWPADTTWSPSPTSLYTTHSLDALLVSFWFLEPANLFTTCWFLRMHFPLLFLWLALFSPFRSPFPWCICGRIFYLKLAFVFMFFHGTFSNLKWSCWFMWSLILYLLSVPQWQESYIPLRILLFGLYLSTVGMKCWGKLGHSKIYTSFTLISLNNPVFYYLYSENFHNKMPRETNAFSSPLRESVDHVVSERTKLVDLQRAWAWVLALPLTGCVT